MSSGQGKFPFLEKVFSFILKKASKENSGTRVINEARLLARFSDFPVGVSRLLSKLVEHAQTYTRSKNYRKNRTKSRNSTRKRYQKLLQTNFLVKEYFLYEVTYFKIDKSDQENLKRNFCVTKALCKIFLSAKVQINYGLVMISCALVWLVSVACADFCGRRGILSIFEKARPAVMLW